MAWVVGEAVAIRSVVRASMVGHPPCAVAVAIQSGGPVARTTSLIQEAAHGQLASLQPRRIDHGSLHLWMPEAFWDGPDVVALLPQRRGPRGAERAGPRGGG
jgi:hypothetical protein